MIRFAARADLHYLISELELSDNGRILDVKISATANPKRSVLGHKLIEAQALEKCQRVFAENRCRLEELLRG